MSRSRQFAVSTLFIGFGWMLAGACSSSSPDGVLGPSGGGSSGSGGVGGSAGTGGPMLVQSGSSNGGSANNINALCGGAGTCVPDDESACRGYMPPTPMGAGGAGGEAAGSPGGVSGDGGMSGGGSAAAGAPNGAAGAQGGENHGGEGPIGGGAGAAAGAAGSNNPPGLAQYSCQVGRANNQAIRQCVPAGTGGADAPCFSAADCAPSLACVSEGDAGRCLPYCCKPGTTCTSGSYCAERQLIKEASDTSNAAPPDVPVCVPADNCSLEDVFPCPAKSQCRCQGDTACMVVRDDGTTTCLKPGTGQQGAPCLVATPPVQSSCAWNYVCSSVTHQCVKICNTDPTKSDCGEQKCQASAELPPNFGVCVGPLK